MSSLLDKFQMEDPLVLIEQSQWPNLLKLYPGDEGITARVTIKTQIVNIQQYPDLPVKFYAPFGQAINGLIIIFHKELSNKVAVFCMVDDKTALYEALLNTKIINRNLFNLFCYVMPKISPLILKIAEHFGKKYVVEESIIAQISIERAMNFEIPDSPDLKVKTLEPKYASTIDEVWRYRHPGSQRYFENMLEKGYGIGLIDKKDDLVGWIFTRESGDLHSLHIKDKYRRRGLGEMLIKIMSKKIANNDIEVFGCVDDENIASKATFAKCGFSFTHVTKWISIFQTEDKPQG